jgi:hypothetical protein
MNEFCRICSYIWTLLNRWRLGKRSVLITHYKPRDKVRTCVSFCSSHTQRLATMTYSKKWWMFGWRTIGVLLYYYDDDYYHIIIIIIFKNLLLHHCSVQVNPCFCKTQTHTLTLMQIHGMENFEITLKQLQNNFTSRQATFCNANNEDSTQHTKQKQNQFACV